MIAARSNPSVPHRHERCLARPRPPADAQPEVPRARGSGSDPRPPLAVHWPRPGLVTVTVGGEIDLARQQRLVEVLHQRLRAAALEFVVLDLSAVTYASSAALELLMIAERRSKQRDCELLVVAGTGPVARLLELTGLEAMFSLRPDMTTAVRHAHR